MAYSSAQACCAPGALPPAEFSPSDTWPLLFASTGSFLHLRTSPPPFLLPRCVSRWSLPTEEPSPLSALHLQGSTRKLFPELSPINPTCRGGWAMISPALYEILAMPDPSTIFICFFFPKCQISFSVAKHNNVSLLNPKLPRLTGTKLSHNPWGPQSAFLSSWHLTAALCQAFPCSAPSPYFTVAGAQETCPPSYLWSWEATNEARGERSVAPMSLGQDCSWHRS